jgi:hypothetical protein
MARNRTRRSRALALAACVGVLAISGLVSAGTAGAAATTMVIKGKLSVANPTQVKVLFLPTSAAAKVASVSSTGTFSLTVKASTTSGASLQLVKAGRYLGPVTLRYANRVGYLRFGALAAGTTLDLHTISVSVTGGFAKLVTQLPTTRLATKRVVVGLDGKPRGAGRLGLVSKQSVASVHSAGVVAMTANPCSQGATENGSGGDCDGDGVPNAVDVDDNGNMSLDMTDPTSSRTSAQLVPWSTLYLGMQNALNASKGEVTAEDIAATIGGENIFAVNFFIQQFSFGSVNPDAVWINCGSIAWCNTSTGTAHVGGMSETPGFTDQAWKDYGGEDWNNGVATPLDHPAAHNGLFRMHRDQGFVWVAGVQPRDGANALTELVPGQILGLDARVGSTTTEIPMALSPYPVTVPAVKAVGGGGATPTDVDYTELDPMGSWNNPVVVDGDGTVSLDFWRPQRLTLPGESGQFRDLGRLHYGMVLNAGGPEIGCSSDATTGYYNSVAPTSLHRTPETGEWAMNLWPLTDTTGDSTTNPDNLLSFTLDVRRCLTDNGVTIPDEGLDVNASLTAASEMMTGGANRAVQQLRLHVEPAPS